MHPLPDPDPRDLRGIMQQNEALKTFIAMLVSRLGGDVTLGPIDFAKTLQLNVQKLPEIHGVKRYHLVAKQL
jgi:hypothetical protein